MKAKPILEHTVDQLQVKVYENRAFMGAAAGSAAADRLRILLDKQDQVNIILGSAPSQNELMDSLVAAENVDWSRITIFHMDEYVGLSADSEQAFSHYLQNRVVSKVHPKQFYKINGNADPDKEILRYSQLLKEHPIDIVCLGIGENGHIAFNDPPVANFNDPELVKMVEIDAVCRQQQVNDKCFAQLNEVPTHAITLTVPELMSGTHLFCVVPGPTKSNAVRSTLNGTISTECPATILRTHSDCTLYLDSDSYGDVQ